MLHEPAVVTLDSDTIHRWGCQQMERLARAVPHAEARALPLHYLCARLGGMGGESWTGAAGSWRDEESAGPPDATTETEPGAVEPFSAAADKLNAVTALEK